MTWPPALTHPAFRTLWVSRVVSFAGDGVAAVALVVLAADAHGPDGVSLMLLAYAVPRFLGPVAGAIADRVDQRRLMVACELGQAALVAVIALAQPPFALLLVLVAAMSGLVALFQPAGRSAVPVLVPPEHRMSANALLSLALNLEVAIGGLLGGALLAAADVRTALLLDAVSFVASAALLARVPPLPPRGSTPERFWSTVAGGLAFARRDRVVRALVVATLALVVLAGVDNVVLVFIARDTLAGGDGVYGLLVGAFGVGMVVAAVVVSLRVAGDPVRLLVAGFVLTGIGNLLTGTARGLPHATVGQVTAGVANAIENVGSDTLVHARVPAQMMGRVFGLIGTCAQIGQVAAVGLAAVALRAVSASHLLALSGVATLAVAGVLAGVMRRATASPPASV